MSALEACANAAAPDLSPTARVILGMITFGKRTGYDIKAFVDKSTRHFWAASYGQIYPELRRLEQQGLVRGRPEPTGGRARTVYELTNAGHAALKQWLQDAEEPLYELRDEGMLKLFFSDVAPQLRPELVHALKARQERKLAQLRAIEDHAKQGPPGPYLTLRLGLAQTEAFIDWCAEAERELAAPDKREP